MRRYADIEELATTKSEKLLAVVMTVFLLLGGIWAYSRVDDDIRERVPIRVERADDEAAARQAGALRQRVFALEGRSRSYRRQVEFLREEYRAALDADRPAAALERRYRDAQRTYAGTLTELARARSELRRLGPTARSAERRVAEAREADRRRQERLIFFARLAVTLAAIAAGYVLLAVLRRRNSRWLALAASTLAFGTILAFVLAADYLTDYWDPFEYGILFLAVIGIAATAAAFWVLQRYLTRRLPQRRARKGVCPFCAYPVRGGGRYCEGCGRDVIAPCTSCTAPRRVGVPHCAACGASAG